MSPLDRVPPHALELPPTYEETQQTDEAVRRKSDQILADISGFSPPDRVRILQRTAKLLNQQPEQARHQIYLSATGASQAGVREVSNPRLNQWIKEKLSFLDKVQLGRLAFATGHWREFKQSLDENPNSVKNQISKFFQEYFAREGTDQGTLKLWQILEHRLFYPGVNDKLETALTSLTEYPVEAIQPDGQSSCNHAFNYAVVTRIVIDNLSTGDLGRLGHYLKITNETTTRIKDEFRDSKLGLYAAFDNFVESSGPEENLYQKLLLALDRRQRRDIREELEAELKRLGISTGSHVSY